jgi:hypothetical protein
MKNLLTKKSILPEIEVLSTVLDQLFDNTFKESNHQVKGGKLALCFEDDHKICMALRLGPKNIKFYDISEFTWIKDRYLGKFFFLQEEEKRTRVIDCL